VTPRAAAARYARALFDVVRKEGLDLDQVQRELTEVADLLRGNPALARALTNPAIPAARKRAVVEQLLERSPVVLPLGRLLLLLADRDRLIVLEDLTAAFRERVMDYQQVVRAEVTTAINLPADRVQALQQGLAGATGRKVQLEARVDPSIIGGAVTRIGSTVYDGSVTTQLQKLKERLSQAEP
jgi:F-type H+-transporting ATPase subunit delta